jgi:putative ABC transport system permease protein
LRLATLGFRNSFRRPFRTVLTVVGISLCVVLMLTVTAVSQSYSTVVGQSYSIYSTNLIVVSRASLLVEGVPIGGSLPEQTVSLVKSVQGVAGATPMLLVVDVQHLVPNNVTIGVPIQNFTMFARTNSITLAGSYPASSNQIVIGGNVATQTDLKVGSTLSEEGMTLVVTGVMSTSNLILANAVLMPLGTAQATQKYTGLISVIMVTPVPGWKGNLTQEIETSIPGVLAVDPSQTGRLTAPLLASIATVNGASDVFSITLALLFVSIIGSVSVLERKEEFATMWAIGGSSSSVLRVALAETGLVSLTGFLLGLVLSVVAASVLFQVYAYIPAMTTFLQPTAVIPLQAMLLAGLAVVGLGLLVGGVSVYSLPKEVE